MSYKNADIQFVLPENNVHWKIIYCPKRRITHNEYCISIEVENKKRQYTCVSFDQLFELIEKIPIEKRCYYEHISHGDAVKFYLDYEYYKIDQNAIVNKNKALLCIQKLFIDVIKIISNNQTICMGDMLVLEASSSEKESYHIILANENIRFLNNHSLNYLIEEVLRITLLLTIKHECIENRNHINKKINNEASLSEIIDTFNLVHLQYYACVNCRIKDLEISVSDICNLFVYNQRGCMIPCVDTKVYKTEQDFRIFMCTKRGENRPLLKTTLVEHKFVSDVVEVFNNNEKVNLSLIKETLQRSLITEPSRINNYCIDINDIWKWIKSIGFDIKKEGELHIDNQQNIKRKRLNQNGNKILASTERELSAELWTKTYLEQIGSSGVIHSINTGKYRRFIMCNIRNMNICKMLHEDYFNDSTIYVNLEEKQFSIRCNRIPCNKKPWVWQPMI